MIALTLDPAESLPGDHWAWRHVGADHWRDGRLLAIDPDACRAVVQLASGSIVRLDWLDAAELDCWRSVPEGRL